jgi:hypothetical protein
MFYSICTFTSVGGQVAVLEGCVAIVCEMEVCIEHSLVHFKQSAMIEFLTPIGVSPIEIHCRMQVVYGDDCVDMSTVCRWAKKCKEGQPGRADLCVNEVDDL